MNIFVVGTVLLASGSAFAESPAPSSCQDRTVCEKECSGGSADACFKAASKQFEKGLHANLELAREASQTLYEKACKNGHQKACARFASNLVFGKNKDPARARTLLENACTAGEAEACDRLGSYWNSSLFGGTADPARAFPYLERGCSLGMSFDCVLAARAHLQGRGVPLDQARGLSELEQACKKGGISACLDLGKAFRTGEYGVKKDAKRAFATYTDLCNTRHMSNACVVLGTMYRDGQGTQRDVAHAAVLYENACQAHNNWGCTRLGELREKGIGGSKDLAAALELYERGCPTDKTYTGAGCYQAARLRERGAPGVERDEATAAALYSRACFPSDLSPDGEAVTRIACAKAGPMLERIGQAQKARFAYQTSCSKFADQAACSAAQRIRSSSTRPPPPPI